MPLPLLISLFPLHLPSLLPLLCIYRFLVVILREAEDLLLPLSSLLPLPLPLLILSIVIPTHKPRVPHSSQRLTAMGGESDLSQSTVALKNNPPKKPSKITCQAPNPPNPNKTNAINLPISSTQFATIK
jgi:hypothetical protein